MATMMTHVGYPPVPVRVPHFGQLTVANLASSIKFECESQGPNSKQENQGSMPSDREKAVTIFPVPGRRMAKALAAN